MCRVWAAILGQKNPQKTVQHVLGRLYPEANNVIIWHDASNNTLSAHPNNFNQPATVDELLQALEPFRHPILALVHCHPTGVPDIYKELRQSEFFSLSVTRDIAAETTRPHNLSVTDPKLGDPPFLKTFILQRTS